ncbi:DUF4238 domain-containing protein [Streptomyces sp. AM2-3-1]|uniref:DUF4238 domain-containing protein n=1 Tax=Streptomyces sp. AM2-3-1 TaxID=3075824 RepID=UPI0028C50851|nr:DUF4238 domain-containing protein [Streptomyces sp. AM2-3-1]WNO64658.1 DUF4238 domain-containing protein [Streptomyces sp. AM2-3-1]
MADRIRRQHTVSKFYLKGFADGSGKICRVSLPGEPLIVLSTNDATVVKDFYTVTLPDGSLSDFFEKAFSNIEGAAAEALRLILAGTWPIEGEAREAFASWVALQHLRSEDIRSGQGRMSAEMIRLIVGVSGKEALRSLIQSSESRAVCDEELDREWRDITKPGGPDMTSNANQHVRLLTSLLPTTAAYLRDCHWTLFRFDRRSIATSDHPVTLAVAPDHPRWQGVGIATAELFLVPLSRRAALTIQPHRKFPQIPAGVRSVPDFTQKGTTAIARSINQETAARARRYIYHHPHETPLQGLYLPNPETRDHPLMGNATDLIREEGLFAGLTDEQLRGLSATSIPGEEDRGMSIDDVPWPIPGRRPRTSG